jgi:hypothetical protein
LSGVLTYDPDTGIFTWRVSTGPRAKVGAVAGALSKDGYIQIRVDGRLYKAHRLAWLWVTGKGPASEVDHINGSKSDNRLCNLRLATPAENQQNQRCSHRDSKSGLLGVTRHRNRWLARITVGGKNEHLGTFDTPELAHAAYLAAKALYHPFQTLVTPAVT